MRSDETIATVGDAFDLVNGFAFKSADFVESGIPVIKIKNVKAGEFSEQGFSYVGEKFLDKRRDKLARIGDLLISMSGNRHDGSPHTWVGKVAYFNKRGRYFINQRVGALRPKQGVEVDLKFAAYVLASMSYQEHFIAVATSSGGQANLSPTQILGAPLNLPCYEEQQEIGRLISALDDRIDLLRQANTTLEAIAQTLFKSWFVDFDPVHAKAEGREPDAMDAAIAALFPSEFEKSELGLIPRGWRVERLSDLVELAYGKALKANDRVPGEIPVYGSGGVTGWHNVALVTEPTIIIGRKGSVGTIYWEDRPCHPIDTVFFVRSQKAPLTLCLQVLRSLGLDKMNTDAAVPGLNRENAYRLEVVAAPTAVNDAWHKIAEPIYDAMSNNSRRCDVLSQLRDTLLPRLISGKLRLPV